MEKQGIAPSTDNQLKKVQLVFTGPEVNEGDGAKVRRFIGSPYLQTLDPFLMLDMAAVKLPMGFPEHPHRGFETVSYLLEGEFLHEDSKGHKGKLTKGDVQWMTAGKGIVHSEMPGSWINLSRGFQLWINLDAKNKFCEPRYQEYRAAEIPVYQDPSFKAKIIAGQVFDVKGPIEARTPTYYIDFVMGKDKTYDHLIPAGWNAFIVVYNGELHIQNEEKSLKSGDCAVFKINEQQDEYLRFRSLTQDDTSFILLAGKPINEPIVWHGPFVVNTKQQVYDAMDDFRKGKNGFEGANNWKSEIGKLKYSWPRDF